MEVRNAKVGNQVFRFGWSEMDQVRGQWFVSVEEAAGLIKALEEAGFTGVHHRSIDCVS